MSGQVEKLGKEQTLPLLYAEWRTLHTSEVNAWLSLLLLVVFSSFSGYMSLGTLDAYTLNSSWH